MDGYTPEQSRKLRALELAVEFANTLVSANGTRLLADVTPTNIVTTAEAFDSFLRT